MTDIFKPIDISLSERILIAKTWFELFQKGEIIINIIEKPWSYTKMSRFIESILLRFPMNNNLFAEDNYRDQYIIIDGNRRLKSIFLFLDNKFALHELKFYPEYNGKKFSELPRGRQRDIEESIFKIQSIPDYAPQNVKEDFKNRVR